MPGSQRDDLAVLYSERQCDAGGVFTTNKVKSASVVIDQLVVSGWTPPEPVVVLPQ